MDVSLLEVMFCRVARKLNIRIHVHLFKNTGAVRAHGRTGERKFVTDLLDRFALHDQREYLILLHRKAFVGLP